MKLYCILIAFFLTTMSFGQNLNFVLNGQVTNYDTGKKEGAVTISIVKGGQTVASAQTATNGKYILEALMPANSKFEVVFKKAGYVVKKISFDYTKFDSEEYPDGADYTPLRSVDMTIFTEKPGLDFSFLNSEPVAIFNFDPERLIPVLNDGAMMRTKAKIEDLINSAAKKANEEQEKYDNAINQADALYAQERFEDAKGKYQEALRIREGEPHPTKRIQEIDAFLAAKAKAAEEQRQKEAAYTAAIKAGDQLRDQKKYDESIAKYNEALKIKAEQYPRDEIKKIEKIKAEENRLAAINTQYQNKITAGDDAFKSKNWAAARANFVEAQKLKPNEDYPKAQLAEIQKQEAAEKAAAELEKNYNAAIAAADAAFGQKNYDLAAENYNKALQLKQGEQHPTARLAEIKNLKAELAANAKLDAEYQSTMASAKQAFDAKNWEEAKQLYLSANGLKPKEALPMKQVNIIDAELKKLEMQANQQKAYDEAIAAADAAKQNENFEEALLKYAAASKVKPSELYPKNQIEEIKNRQQEILAEKEKEQSYKQHVDAGDQYYDQSKYPDAIDQYEKASEIKPEETYPKQKIAQSQEKIKEQKDVASTKAKVDALFKEGQVLIDKKSYTEAKNKYLEIQSIDKTNNLAQVKLDEIDRLIEKDKKAKTLEADFRRFVDEGDMLVKGNDWVGAKEKYGAALLLKEDAVVRDKYKKAEAAMIKEEADALVKKRYDTAIKEADALRDAGKLTEAKAKYKQAQLFDELATYPKEQVAKIDAKMQADAATEAAYKAAMTKGDQLMAQQKYLEAIKEFNKALQIKPTEPEPKQKADECERLEKAKSTEGDEQFEKILTVADKKKNEADFDRAIELYERAKTFRPEDPRPDKALAEIAEVKRIDELYNNKMKQAELAVGQKQYDQAIQLFEEAQKVKPKEPLPPQRIAAIKEIRDKTANEAQRLQRYNEEFGKGMAAYKAKEYVTALSYFNKSMEYKPNDPDAQAKIDEIRQIMDEDAKRNQAMEEKRKAFDKFIERADGLFEQEKWQEAKQVYQQALSIDYTSQYAKKQVEMCVAQMRMATQNEKDKQYNKLIAAADKNFNSETYEKAKDYYTRARGMRPNDPYPVRKLQEIENILNPVIVETGKLQPLGETFEGDAGLELAKAQADINNQQATGVIEIKDASIAQNAQLQEDLTQNTREADKYLFDQGAKQRTITEEGDSRTKENEQTLEDTRDKVEQDQQMNEMFNRSDNLKQQERLDYTKTDVRKAEDVYREAQLAVGEATKQEVELINKANDKLAEDNAQSQVNNAQSMRKVNADYEMNTMNDDAERRRTAVQIHDQNQQDIANQNSYNNQSYDRSQKSTSSVNEQIRMNAQKESADAKNAGYNNQEVVDYQRDVIEQNDINLKVSNNQSANVVQALDELEENLAAIDRDQKVNNQDNAASIQKMDETAKAQITSLEQDQTDALRNQQNAVDAQNIKTRTYQNEARLEQELNNVDLTDMKSEVNRQAEENQRKDEYDGTNRQLKVDDVNRKMQDLNIQSSDNQYQNKDAVAELKVPVQKQMDDLISENDQNSKNISRDAAVLQNAIQEKSTAEQASPRANDVTIEQASQKIEETTTDYQQRSQEQQLGNRDKVHDLAVKVEEDAYRTTEKQEGNQDKLQDLGASVTDKLDELNTKNTSKSQKSQAKIDDVDPKVEITKAKNSIGEEYPEGVTEENFQRKDTKGRLREVLTRRIVVKDGHGDVYVRSQTAQGVTYTKNGQSITSYVWQQETQGPKVESN